MSMIDIAGGIILGLLGWTVLCSLVAVALYVTETARLNRVLKAEKEAWHRKTAPPPLPVLMAPPKPPTQPLKSRPVIVRQPLPDRHGVLCVVVCLAVFCISGWGLAVYTSHAVRTINFAPPIAGQTVIVQIAPEPAPHPSAPH